ncbi:MAG: carbohydrate ABC transporter permease [Sphaerochaetaceae bacterium]
MGPLLNVKQAYEARSGKNKKFMISLLKTIILAVFAICFMLPLLWMFSSSLKGPTEVFGYPMKWIPKTIRWSNYVKVWTDPDIPFLRLYYNSLFIVIFSIIGCLLTSSLAGYAFAKMDFAGKDILFMLLLATMMIPSQVTIIPRFMLFKMIGLYNTHWALILPSWFSVTAIFLLRQTYHSLPNELIDAAVIDGCSHRIIWLRVLLPLTKPALVSLMVLQFISGWNEYLSAIVFLLDKSLYTVSQGVQYYYASEAQEFNFTMAAATSAVIPIIILFISAQKYFIEGIASSGMKE